MANGPVGEVITALGRFTHCVRKADYKNPPSFGLEAGLGTLGKESCAYVTGDKLICLQGGSQVCAVGTIVHIEPVGYEKSGYELIDNDFCINLLLFPHELGDFSNSPDMMKNWDTLKKDDMQGWLLNQDQTAGVTPRDPGDSPPNLPYTRTFLFGEPGGPRPYEPNPDKTDRLLEEVKQNAGAIKRVPIPVLHCEFEGSGVYAVCSAIAPLLDLTTGGPGKGVCRATIGLIPGLGDLVCTIVETVIAVALAPLIALAALSALATATAVDELAITGPLARQIELGETVIVTGRWVWDGGHGGYNELHATFTLQNVVLPETAGISAAEVNSLVETWCRLSLQLPPTKKRGQAISADLTPEQQETATNQQKPENNWDYHPAVDGCQPEQPQDNTPILK